MPFLRLKTTVIAFGACLAAALFVAGCGGDDAKSTTTTSSATGAGTTNASTAPTTATTSEPENISSDGGNGNGVACSLITTAQVSDVTGTAMKDGVGLGGVDAAYSNCKWDGQTETATLSLDFFRQDSATYYTEGSDNEGKTAVAGIGEKARWSTLLSTLEVVQGDYYFAVYVHTASNEDNQAAATTAAAIVLQSLA